MKLAVGYMTFQKWMNNYIAKLMKVIVVCPKGKDLEARNYLRRQTDLHFPGFLGPWSWGLPAMIHQHCCTGEEVKTARQLLGSG